MGAEFIERNLESILTLFFSSAQNLANKLKQLLFMVWYIQPPYNIKFMISIKHSAFPKFTKFSNQADKVWDKHRHLGKTIIYSEKYI